MTADIHAVTMPKMGLTMETGSVAAWHAEPGTSVSVGDALADIETEKVTTVYEAPVSGIWRRAVAGIGVDLAVGSLIGIIANADVSDADIDTFIADFKADTKV